MKANPEVVEGDRGVVRKQGAQLVQAGQHHKGAAMMLGRQSNDMCPDRGHDATIGQHSVSAHQHLHKSHCLSGDDDASVVMTVPQHR